MITVPEKVPAKLTAVQTVSGYALRESQQLPSELMRRFEADLIGELARRAAWDGKRFDGWPTIRLDPEVDYLRNAWTLRAEVTAR